MALSVQLVLDILQVLVPVRCPSGMYEVHFDAWVVLLHLLPYPFGISRLNLIPPPDEDRYGPGSHGTTVVPRRQKVLFGTDGFVAALQIVVPVLRQA